MINPILSGWVNYFAIGDSCECFAFIKDWVDKKVRRHMMRARNRSRARCSVTAAPQHQGREDARGQRRANKRVRS